MVVERSGWFSAKMRKAARGNIEVSLQFASDMTIKSAVQRQLPAQGLESYV